MSRLLLLILATCFPLSGCQADEAGWSWRADGGHAVAETARPAETAIDLPPGVVPLAPAQRPKGRSGGRGPAAPAPAVLSDDLPEVVIGGRTYIYGARYEPPKGRILVGMGQWAGGNAEYLAKLDDPRLNPAGQLLFLAIGDWPRPWDSRISRLLPGLREQQAQGRFPNVSLSMHGVDPATTHEVAIDDEIARGVERYDDRIAQVARVLRDLGGPVFVRPGPEFNGDWNGYHPYEYPKAYRRIVDIFRREGADNCVFTWSYEPSAPDDFDVVDAAGPRWFPGEDVVDWFGLDLFDANEFSGSPGRNGLSSPLGNSEKFLAMARKLRKPVTLDEVSAARVNITADPADGKRAWADWFDPFFAFLRKHPEIRAFYYINFDWTHSRNTAGQGWQDGRVTGNAYILDRWRQELSKGTYLFSPDASLLNGYAESWRTQKAPAPGQEPPARARGVR